MSSIAVAALLSALIGVLAWIADSMRVRGVASQSREPIRAALGICFVGATTVLVFLNAQLVPIDITTFVVMISGLIIFVIQSYRGFAALAQVPPNKSLERTRGK